MWLFTKYGFFSATCAREGDGAHHRPIDPARIMVRARAREHLEALQRRFTDLLAGCAIFESTGTDYKYRLFVSKPTWTKIAAEMAAETDYDNFKGEVADHVDVVGRAYESALHDVWGVMFRLQK